MLFYPLLGKFLLLFGEITSQNSLIVKGNGDMIFSVLRMDMGYDMVLLHGAYDKLDPILNADLTTDLIYHENMI